jgi:hypothetical protein
MIFPFSFDCPFDFAQGMDQDRPFVQCDSNRVIVSQPVGCGPAPGTSRRVCRRSASVSTNRFCATEVATTNCRSGATGIKWPAYTIPQGVSFVCDFGLIPCGACTACAAITTVAPLLRHRHHYCGTGDAGVALFDTLRTSKSGEWPRDGAALRSNRGWRTHATTRRIQ